MKKIIKILTPLIFLALAVLVAYFVGKSETYVSGVDTLCHLYKGDVLYKAILNGDLWPSYDPLWYNGVEMLRYWAPLPVYVLALCEFAAGGTATAGFIVFVGFIFFAGATSWFYVGCKTDRPLFGALIGILWFFMPNNLIALFYEGNLPRSICIVILPVLMYLVYDYLCNGSYKTFPKISLCFAVTSLCHSGYAGMILIAFLIYFLINSIVGRKWMRGVEVTIALILGYMLTGVWLVPSLIGGITSTDSSEIMAGFFQSFWLSINPVARIIWGSRDFYFGLAALLLSIFGALLSKRKSMPGFITAIIVLLMTSNTAYLVLSKLPGGQFLWMLRFISIALCMMLFSLLIWDTLKKKWVVLFVLLLILDALPSQTLVFGTQSGKAPEETMAEYADWTLIGEAKEATDQRLALVDESSLDSMSAYLLTGYGEAVATSYGAAWQSATTATNFKQIDLSLEEGEYLYLFDRCLEMGNDTVVVKLSLVKDIESNPVEKMDEAASKAGYKLIDANDQYRFYKLDTELTDFGTVSTYRILGIGSQTASISRQFPAVEESSTDNLSDFTFEDLKDYDTIYLAGFTYDDREAAEELVTRLSEAGVRIVLLADGIPEDTKSHSQSFLGLTCSSVSFSQGYPILETTDGTIEDTDLFPDGYREWNTVYVQGLDEVWGRVEDDDWDLPFYGTVKNENIVVVGLNLTYYYSLTHDESIGELLSGVLDLDSSELPKREIVSCSIEYAPDTITVETDADNVNTALAWHDSFESDNEIRDKNNLTYVSSGKTVITITYPYVGAGAAVTAATALIIAIITIYRRKRERT